MKIQLDSGEKLEVPDGSTPQQIDEVITHFQSTKQPVVSEPQDKGMIQSMTDRTLSQNVGDVWEGLKSGTVPFSDEIQAGIAAGVARPFVDTPYTELYRQAKYGTDGVQGTLQRQQEAEQNPLAYYPAMLGGAVLTGVGASNRATQLSPELAKFAAQSPKLAASGTGAIQGGLYGAGTGEGSAKEIASQAGLSAIGGAVLAPLAVVANERVFSPLASKAMRIFSKSKLQPATQNLPLPELLSKIDEEKAVQGLTYQGAIAEGRAMDKIANAIKKDFPDNYEQVLSAWKQSDQPLSALYSPQVTSLAKGAAQYPSGQKAATAYFEPATIEAQQKMASTIPAVDNFYSTVDDVIEKGQANASPIYKDAFKFNSSLSSQRLDSILNRPAARDALKTVAQDYQNKSALLATPDPELTKLAKELADLDMMAETKGGVSGGLKLSVLDAIKKELDLKVRGAKRAMDMGNDNGNTYRALDDVRRALVSEIDNLDTSGLYAKARATSGDYITVSKAMENGRDFARFEPDLIAKNLSKMSDAEKEAYKSGVATQLKETILKKTEGANPYNSVMGSPTQQKRLMKIFSASEYNKIKTGLEAENKLFKMRNEVLSGSPTTSKAIAAGMIADGGEAALASLATGKPTTMGVIKSIITKSFDGLNDKTAGEVSKLIYETDPVKKLQMLQKLGGNKMLSQTEKQAVKSTYFKAMEVIGQKQLTTGSASGAVISETTKPEPLRITVTPQDRNK